MTLTSFLHISVTGMAGAGSADDAVCVGDPECDRRARLSVRSQAAHHRVPDAQERPQAHDDDRRERPSRGRCSQQVAVEERLHRDAARRRHHRGGWRRICRPSALVRLRRFPETIWRHFSIWLFSTRLYNKLIEKKSINQQKNFGLCITKIDN